MKSGFKQRLFFFEDFNTVECGCSDYPRIELFLLQFSLWFIQFGHSYIELEVWMFISHKGIDRLQKGILKLY